MEQQEISELIKFSKILKVLYVEDNQDARMQTSKILNNFFVDVVVAVDGNDGLDKFMQDKYDLVITDINMPNKNGLDMLKDIKDHDDEIFCLIISAHNESNYFIDAIELGVDGFLMKPVKIDQFIPLILKTIKRIQNALEVKEVAIRQAKLASMGEMIDSIAHQWKQPLNVIQLRLQSLGLDIKFDELTNERVIDAITSSEEQIKHLVNTMDEFRVFFRPDTTSETITLKSIVDSSILLMHDELIKNTIEVEIIGDISIEVSLNANEFKHVIINIVNNAKDAFVDNKIDAEDRKIIFDIQAIEDQAILLILDRAGGIPQDIIGHIFDAHFTTKGPEKGTGIGLHMTKQIVEKIGGDIEVFNEKDGACFKIIINKVS